MGEGECALTGNSAESMLSFLCEQRRAFADAARRPAFPAKLEAALRERLDRLTAEDLCVSPSDAAVLRGPSGVGYQQVYHGPEMTVCIFLLRAGAVIPLHDHPGMHVFGRLLFGRMRVLSCDLDGPPTSYEAGLPVRPARWGADEVLGPEPVTYSLGPSSGNLHELEALDHCAFFDVLTPPYDPREERDCTYFRCHSQEAGSNSCHLIKFDPEGFGVGSVPYKGPRFWPQ